MQEAQSEDLIGQAQRLESLKHFNLCHYLASLQSHLHSQVVIYDHISSETWSEQKPHRILKQHSLEIRRLSETHFSQK